MLKLENDIPDKYCLFYTIVTTRSHNADVGTMGTDVKAFLNTDEQWYRPI